jgi:hypothetical protein
MRAWYWLAVAGLGFGLMLLAYTTRPALDPAAPWAHGVIVVGPEASSEDPPLGPTISTRLRLLPGNERTEVLLQLLGQGTSIQASHLKAQLRPKLIAIALDTADVGARMLQSGRLPTAGRDEILAGAQATPSDQISVAGRTLEVVGVLRPDAVLFVDCYLVPPSASTNVLFAEGDSAVHPATLIRLSAEQVRDRNVHQQLEAAYPSARCTRVMSQAGVDRRTFYLYVAGFAGLLFGGAGTWIGLFHWLAGRVRWPLLAGPLQEMRRRQGLLWATHMAYFGLVILAALLIYELPEIQTVLLSAVGSEFETTTSPLGVAGKAYASGSIPLAAAVTFLINFLLGSLLLISLPSALMPGAGALLAAFRAVVWGLVLAPASVLTAAVMLPHSWTLLLEGEGYVLAAFFGLLIPIHLCQPSLGGSAWSRFGRVLLLNLKANVLVALVLAVAACYEAIEAIKIVTMVR